MANKSTDFTIADYLWLSGEPGQLILVEESNGVPEPLVRVSVLTATNSACFPRKPGESLEYLTAKGLSECALQAALGV